MKLAEFTPSAGRSSGENGEKVNAKDLIGAVLLIKVNKLSKDVKTKFGEKDAINIDVCGIATGKVATDQLWFNGAVVDSLAPYVGQVVPLKLVWTQGSGPNPYIAAEALSEVETAGAQAYLDKADPFAQGQGNGDHTPLPPPVLVGTSTTDAPRW